MSTPENDEGTLLPHHEQQELCTTRLPYRQGRKLTAVKVYTINNESKHLLIFGVPFLNLRRETKELFMKFGKLLQFNLAKYPSEEFTKTYHALYESIQSARIAKKMLDTKNYYGGNLHICYAPELETVEDTKEKLLLRKTQVLGRLKNLQRDAEVLKISSNNVTDTKNNEPVVSNIDGENIQKMYMGSVNTIAFGKRKEKGIKGDTKKPKHERKEIEFEISNDNIEISRNEPNVIQEQSTAATKYDSSSIEIIDFTSPQTEVISNINEALNYKKFGNEIIRQVPYKPVNKIKFNINKNSKSLCCV